MNITLRYDNASVRRQDRLLDAERAFALLNEGEYGFLALGGEEGGYGIPVSFVCHADKIYFHCALEGEKLRRIEQCNQATFCVVGHTAPEPSKFTTKYESVLVKGTIYLVDNDDERMQALLLIVDKYAPDYKEIGRKSSERSLNRTGILRLDIENISGKCKK